MSLNADLEKRGGGDSELQGTHASGTGIAVAFMPDPATGAPMHAWVRSAPPLDKASDVLRVSFEGAGSHRHRREQDPIVARQHRLRRGAAHAAAAQRTSGVGMGVLRTAGSGGGSALRSPVQGQ